MPFGGLDQFYSHQQQQILYRAAEEAQRYGYRGQLTNWTSFDRSTATALTGSIFQTYWSGSSGSTDSPAHANYLNFIRWDPATQPKLVLPRARARARRLLKRTLTDDQRAMLRKLGYFEVEGSRTSRIYRIKTGIVRNVILLDARGREVEQLCAHPAGSVPDFDAMLAQKLMLEAAEDDFLGIANKTPLVLPQAA